ncbi:MAG: (2Fe-2S)-binding protein [Zetaproteobacteria bacterium]|nr:(2Fe-2S)-binding protein [Zetaproteobacteria bacterium]
MAQSEHGNRMKKNRNKEGQAASQVVLRQVVCICKGIALGSVLKSCQGAETVGDVNQACGSGSGGCRGQRCGPKIRALLARKNGYDPGPASD